MSKFTREEVIQVIEDGRKCAGADLRGIDLPKANLRGANLNAANLHRAELRGAKYNANTKWPAGFDPVAAGAVLYT